MVNEIIVGLIYTFSFFGFVFVILFCVHNLLKSSFKKGFKAARKGKNDLSAEDAWLLSLK